MKFQPKTEQQIESEMLIPEGWHEATVTAAAEETSTKGNDMITLTLKVYGPEGERVMRDWLLPSFPRKLKHFCDAAGLENEYAEGSLKDDMCVDKTVMVEVKHTVGKGEYAGRVNANANDYRKAARSANQAAPARTVRAKPQAEPVEITADDIPF